MLSFGARRTARLNVLKNFRPHRRAFSALAGGYHSEMYKMWKANPASVHPSWDIYFKNSPSPEGGAIAAAGGSSASYLIRAYQVRGHQIANVDPLGIRNLDQDIPELDYRSYGFSEADLDAPVDLAGISSVAGLASNSQGVSTLRELLTFLKSVYCGSVGIEFMHIQDRDRCNWMRERFEKFPEPLPKEKKVQILERLAFAERFEVFLANKWNTAKRFGIEGLESLTPGLKALIDRSSELGVENMAFGMPHRGRLNVLGNVMRKPLEMIFKEFAGTHINTDPNDWSGSGDVKYHLGTAFRRTYPDGRTVALSMAANPSHLECVNPVVLGKAKAKQFYGNDPAGEKTMAILLHGDAAFAGQGIVYETMQCAKLKGYGTGGTIHVIMNNQVGFTTDPEDGRSTMYSSDLGKTFDAPVFHVNADDTEAVVRVFNLAAEWRQQFKTDVIIDVIGYRRHGHNELDQPMFTQPMMYSVINTHPTPLAVHITKLLTEGFSQAEIDACIAGVDNTLQEAFEASKTYEIPSNNWTSQRWKNILKPNQLSPIRSTGVSLDLLKKIGSGLVNIPGSFVLHRQVNKVYNEKKQRLVEGKNIDWGTAEGLAFGVLLQQGCHVRLSGEDVERGTFSHRHCVVNHQKTGEKFTPLNHIEGNKSEFTAFNSFLSEFAVLAFDLGYSMEHPNSLVLWEAQFGDFVNGAQITIDNFLSCGEAKWLRQSGLVLLLPHGYDGNGPDHSSCRIERFLQQTEEDEDVVPDMSQESRMQIQSCNWQVVNCTTPANYFHVLLRQINRDFRKPLIVVAPKNMLRLRECASDFEDFAEGTSFKRMFPETFPDEIKGNDEIRRVIFCSGKIYYELLAQRRSMKCDDVAIVRLEQIAPFPFDRTAEYIAQYPNAEVVWVQEEPKNQGAWVYANDRIATAVRHYLKKDLRARYIGRGPMAASAEGYGATHVAQQKKILETAFT
eukprot:CAMPEP_0175137640 /NCGR_PEP_ID=MMETSP0087-20121206/9922_1 /TAXON_ID=136419 /ORGANISM="Unknown Unknown, Strain D1" /LENGTH=953 /DNA_ID=CAMNT_0016420487 /DNA_START=29 /DNA_END=2890 /DNA_ORIENTATION=-